MRRSTWILAAAVLAAAPLQAQTPEQRVERAMQRAAAAGLPTSLLESKVAEGRAKGVDMHRIALAVEQRLDGIQRARTALARASEVVTHGDLSAGADALHNGVSEAALTSLARSTSGDSRTVAIVALAELVRQGHPLDHALAQVREAVARGPEALQNLPAHAASRAGQPPGRSGEARPTTPGKPGARPAGPPPGRGRPNP
jgi:hypothetical protein